MLGITKNLLLIGSSFSCCPCKQAGNSFGICYRRSELVCGAVPTDLLLPSRKRDLLPFLHHHHHHCDQDNNNEDNNNKGYDNKNNEDNNN